MSAKNELATPVDSWMSCPVQMVVQREDPAASLMISNAQSTPVLLEKTGSEVSSRISKQPASNWFHAENITWSP